MCSFPERAVRVRALAAAHCVVSLVKTLNSHSASLHPGVQMGTGEVNAGGNPAMEKHPIQQGLEIFLVSSCYRNRDKLQPDGHLARKQTLPYLTLQV